VSLWVAFVAPAIGSAIVNVAPSPTTLVTPTDPPWASAIACTIASPNPLPPLRRAREASTR